MLPKSLGETKELSKEIVVIFFNKKSDQFFFVLFLRRE